jgi:diguanylate cyclase (GGDEF)-like protein/PAS domain S-box-containing protein
MRATSLWLQERKIDMASLLAMEARNDWLLGLAERLGSVGHWWVRLSDQTITWSAEVYEIHGLSQENFKPDMAGAISFYHPDDRDAVAAAVEGAARDGTPFEFALRLIRADGALRHVRSRGIAIAGPDHVPAHVFGVFVDITEERAAEDGLRAEIMRLQQIAYVDALTQLANRRQFDEALKSEWLRAIREETPLSLVMLDIDRFKRFNDLYGHLAGDECLRIVAAAVKSILRRPADLMARYGGEEFALLLPVTDESGAVKLADRVRTAINALQLIHAGNAPCGEVVTASLGVSTAYPQPGSSPEGWLDLIKRADALLYEAKRTGRNRVISAVDFGAGGPAALPKDEISRLAALSVYERAGATRRTAELDRIAKLAAMLTASPIGLVSLVAADKQYFAGSFGISELHSTGRDVSFCAHTILGDEPFVVPDALQDDRFKDNALVTGALGLRYYAGAPIFSQSTGHRLGALCVIDQSPRAETNAAQRAVLADLAKMVATLLEEKLSLAG